MDFGRRHLPRDVSHLLADIVAPDASCEGLELGPDVDGGLSIEPECRRIPLGVRSFEVAVRNDARTAMAGTDDVDHVQIIVFDQPVEMDIEEIQSCCRRPMTEQTGLDMFELEGVSSNGLSCR